MAVADTRKMVSSEDGGRPTWLQDAVGYLPRKYVELRTFFVEVRSELRNVTWPGRQEILSTTVVVVVTAVFFGFYLYLLDLALTYLVRLLVKQIT